MFLSEEEIINAVLSFDGDKVTEVTKKALKQGQDVAKKLLKVTA